MYLFLNYFFFVFHTALIFFNTFGWLVRRTRACNLATLLLTFFSWFGMGIWFGWGYCFCTDWHWKVRAELGYRDMSGSYNHFLIKKVFGLDLSESLVNDATVVIFFISLAGSLYVNYRDRRRRNSPGQGMAPPWKQ
jgi:hypothetical protein